MNIQGKMKLSLELDDLFSNKTIKLERDEVVELRDINVVLGKTCYFVYARDEYCFVFTKGMVEKATTIEV